MTNDGPSVHPTGYKGGLSLRDATERLTGHLEASECGWSVNVTMQVYASDGTGLVTSALRVTPEEACEFAAALQMAAQAARQQRYEQSGERFLRDLSVAG